jgi:Kef-type K+ transport system membrane component KefB/nucleotide-binding universal stress UspA family protein
MNLITAAPHSDVLALIIQVCVLLLFAKLFGELSQRLNQPAVIGEILAGIVLGPSLLGKIFPFFYGTVIPANPTQCHLLEIVSLIGAVLLLLVTGFETDLNFISRHGRTAVLISWGGIFLPLLTGFYLGKFLPDALLANPAQRDVFALFIATAMSISAIPVIAKVLIDMKLIRRNIGQITIASGMMDDTIGWILLSIVLGMVSNGGFTWMNLFGSVSKVFLFIFLSFTIGFFFVKKALSFVQDRFSDNDKVLSFVMIMTFAWGALAQALHLEVVFGAFAMGIMFGQMPRFPHYAIENIKSFAMGVFAPIFFALVGLKVDIGALIEPRLALIALVVIILASFGKIFGVYMVSRWVLKHDRWTALSYGAALNARGGMEIIVASIGLSVGILSREMFSIIVLMAVVTSIMAPLILRYTLVHLKPDEDEHHRLKEEELKDMSLVKNIYKVLIPVRFQVEKDYVFMLTQAVKFYILEKIAAKNPLSITLLSVVSKDQKEEAKKMLDVLGKNFNSKELIKKVVESNDVSNQVLNEAQKDYDMLMLGTVNSGKNSDSLFSPVTDSLVRLSPSPITAVVYAKDIQENWKPKNILVPINGSVASRNAAEFAYFLAGQEDQVTILNIISRDRNYWGHFIYNKTYNVQSVIAHSLVDELVDLGKFYKVSAKGKVRIANDLESEIVNITSSENIDLIVLGTSIKPASERLFLGPTVERIIKSASCPVIILNTY